MGQGRSWKWDTIVKCGSWLRGATFLLQYSKCPFFPADWQHPYSRTMCATRCHENPLRFCDEASFCLVFIIVPNPNGYNYEGKGILELMTVVTGERDINRKEIQLKDIQCLPLLCSHLFLPSLPNLPKHSPRMDWKVDHSCLRNTQTLFPNWGKKKHNSKWIYQYLL